MPSLAPSRTITIRPAYGDDHPALVRLAALDSAPGVPAGPILLAEVDEQLRAALSLADRSVIADPFFPTQALVALLRTHAMALAAVPAGRSRSRLRARLPRAFVLTG
jgi:hypothetical protein